MGFLFYLPELNNTSQTIPTRELLARALKKIHPVKIAPTLK
jgi:hypothetical protein